jgi:hypothetical protein
VMAIVSPMDAESARGRNSRNEDRQPQDPLIEGHQTHLRAAILVCSRGTGTLGHVKRGWVRRTVGLRCPRVGILHLSSTDAARYDDSTPSTATSGFVECDRAL